VDDLSGAGEVRRRAATLAASLGFDETDQGAVSVIAAEAAKNIALHAREGEVLVRTLRERDSAGVELLALDKGPGIPDVARCMRDGYSTAGTAGIGMGAMSRMSTTFDIYSTPENGTAVLAQYWPRKSLPPSARPMRVGVVQIPKSGEEICGDAAVVLQDEPDITLILIADGLGHGPLANDASTAAVRVLREHRGVTLERLLELMHAALRPTRGAAASIAQVNVRTREVHYAGVGNVAGTILAGPATRSMATHNGTLGHSMRKAQGFSYPWPADGMLIMHSDGLATQWKLDKYPGLSRRHPSLIAGVLYRDFNRGRDDVTVVAAREPDSAGSPA
jgi:anti-sigma regulatory factor (Ser/Thr protein kinase)